MRRGFGTPVLFISLVAMWLDVPPAQVPGNGRSPLSGEAYYYSTLVSLFALVTGWCSQSECTSLAASGRSLLQKLVKVSWWLVSALCNVLSTMYPFIRSRYTQCTPLYFQILNGLIMIIARYKKCTIHAYSGFRINVTITHKHILMHTVLHYSSV